MAILTAFANKRLKFNAEIWKKNFMLCSLTAVPQTASDVHS